MSNIEPAGDRLRDAIARALEANDETDTGFCLDCGVSVVRSAEVAVAALRDILTREPELIAELGWWRVGGVNNVWNEDLSVNVVFYALANRLKDSRTAFAPPVPVREGERSDG